MDRVTPRDQDVLLGGQGLNVGFLPGEEALVVQAYPPRHSRRVPGAGPVLQALLVFSSRDCLLSTPMGARAGPRDCPFPGSRPLS